MKKLIRTFKHISILILAIALLGCEEEDTVLPKVVAGFSYTLNADTGTVTFINLSTQATNYSWDFGDETSSTLINPVKTYPNGTYTIILTASVVAGSSSTFQDEITILIPEIATIPITFDGENTKYEAEVFGGASFEVVDNPAPGGANANTSKVGAITNSGAEYEGISFDLGSDLDFTTNKSISINFWADEPVDVLLKFEEGTGGDIQETASHGGTGWEIIIFNFNSSDEYSKLTLFVDGLGTTAGAFYIDDINQIETPLTCTEEDMQSLGGSDLNMTFMADIPSERIISDGTTFEIIDNPDFDNEINKSCKVAKITKLNQNPWDNSQIDLDSKLDFNSHDGLKIKVWSARENTEVRIKLEEIGNKDNNFETFLTTSVTSGWEELTFPFSSAESDRFDKIVIFFDLNAENTDTYYFDDLMLYGTGSGGGGGTAFDDGLLTNGDFETGDGTAWYGNALDVRTEGGNSFTFAEVGTPLPANSFEINLSQKGIEMIPGKTYKLSFDASSDGNRTIIAGIGDTFGDFKSVDRVVNLTAETQTFTYDLVAADIIGGLDNRIFFDLGGDTGVVVIDNVSLFCLDCDSGGGGGGTSSGFPLNFEDGINIFSPFEGAIVDVIDNPQPSGNTSSKVLELIKPSGTPFYAGVNSSQGLGGPLVNLANGMIFTMKIWSPKPNIEVRARLEQEPGVIDPPAYQIFQTVANANEWVTLTFDFSDQAMSSYTYTRLVINTDWANGGDGQPIYIDDIEQSGATNGGGGSGGGSGGGTGGGGGAVDGGLTNNGDFETGDTTGYTIFDAQGGVFTVTNEEAQSGSFSGKLVAGEGTEIVIKQANLNSEPAIGTGVSVTISFDLKGSLAGAGGVVFAEFFSEKSPEGVSKAEILGGAPLTPTDTWTNYTFTTTTGDDVSGGVTLQLKAACGAVSGCGVIAYFDNVSVTMNQ
ncbi:PKD domain-containing protein [Thalassobellus suaedae]|uniref:Carbohydrate binding domain-containing protein n=1 Tax=Thalassobellus suaedae TaxID=3074124 RepID=A0ABY9Y726_9FLAO|nr:carbohydrate binding domain-containing protein [Flavobacteriaceae bacterium HL-DH10]